MMETFDQPMSNHQPAIVCNFEAAERKHMQQEDFGDTPAVVSASHTAREGSDLANC